MDSGQWCFKVHDSMEVGSLESSDDEGEGLHWR